MSEKRFKMEIPINNGNHPLLKDNKTGEIVEIVNVEMLIERMNEQQATIKELEEEIKLLKPTNIEQYEQIVQLQEENEQLEKGKMEALSSLGGEIDKNEQLKRIIKIKMGELLKLVDNQQAIIQKQERRIEALENLLTNMGVKWVGDDD